MNKTVGVIAAVIVAGGGAGFWYFRTRGEPAAHLRVGVPVVVEVYSAEGCSSCPPADEYVAGLDRTQPIDGVQVIALELHVDYWDRLGWQDPFESKVFVDRQVQYASVLEDHRTYTPQIIFDGDKLMVGGDEARAREQMIASAAEPRARVTIDITGRGAVSIVVSGAPIVANDALEAWLAVTESHLESDPVAGQNMGRKLTHGPIVRELRKVGVLANDSFRGDAQIDIPSSWRPAALRYVAFVQATKTRKIVGAAARNAHD